MSLNIFLYINIYLSFIYLYERGVCSAPLPIFQLDCSLVLNFISPLNIEYETFIGAVVCKYLIFGCCPFCFVVSFFCCAEVFLVYYSLIHLFLP